MRGHGDADVSVSLLSPRLRVSASRFSRVITVSCILSPVSCPLYPDSDMEHIWSPWRYKYIASADRETGCVFCRVHGTDPREATEKDQANYVVFRGELNFVILNLYPYTSGHLMIAPYEHTASLSEIDLATTAEMMVLAKRAQLALEAEYKPEGYNIGMNLGKCAGAGVADHLHLHVVPRWTGDANFVSVIGETRVLPEELPATWDKLRKRF